MQAAGHDENLPLQAGLEADAAAKQLKRVPGEGGGSLRGGSSSMAAAGLAGIASLAAPVSRSTRSMTRALAAQGAGPAGCSPTAFRGSRLPGAASMTRLHLIAVPQRIPRVPLPMVYIQSWPEGRSILVRRLAACSVATKPTGSLHFEAMHITQLLPPFAGLRLQGPHLHSYWHKRQARCGAQPAPPAAGACRQLATTRASWMACCCASSAVHGRAHSLF